MTNAYDQSPQEANRTRAHWALVALEAFGNETGQNYFDGTLSVDEAELREVAGDLLADLFHLARINDVLPEVITGAAYLHFEAEVAEEEAPGEAPANVAHCPACAGPMRYVIGQPHTCADCGGHLPGGTNAGPGRGWEGKNGWLLVVELDDEEDEEI
ncbi:hypothetical protein AB0B15_38250 [Streptomyces sp. NPDC045456]|uniref:hypothetical protein n=1 Tax=Streptomyces sp. NPDC045456 TaxID=3155254 RepID=UPI0033E1D285